MSLPICYLARCPRPACAELTLSTLRSGSYLLTFIPASLVAAATDSSLPHAQPAPSSLPLPLPHPKSNIKHPNLSCLPPHSFTQGHLAKNPSAVHSRRAQALGVFYSSSPFGITPSRKISPQKSPTNIPTFLGILECFGTRANFRPTFRET